MGMNSEERYYRLWARREGRMVAFWITLYVDRYASWLASPYDAIREFGVRHVDRGVEESYKAARRAARFALRSIEARNKPAV